MRPATRPKHREDRQAFAFNARRTAPKRIGVAYQLRHLADPGQWIAVPLP